MKIFKPNECAKIKKKEDLVSSILDNNFSIPKKFSNLLNSFDDLMSSPDSYLSLIEKLIVSMNGNIRYPRIGDNNERFDAFIEFCEYDSVVEIEIPSTAILDAPRNLLDDYAIMLSRNKMTKKPIIPLVICWDLPNKRSDYWNVIQDIRKVLNLQIKTISIPALALHYWSKTKLDLLNEYYLDIEHQKMHLAYELMSNNNIPSHKALGYLEPLK